MRCVACMLRGWLTAREGDQAWSWQGTQGVALKAAASQCMFFHEGKTIVALVSSCIQTQSDAFVLAPEAEECACLFAGRSQLLWLRQWPSEPGT